MSANPTHPGHCEFVALATFRRNGDAVPTTVWLVANGDEILITTGGGTGKVKRINNNPGVQLRPSTRSGDVDTDAPTWSATARIDNSAPTIETTNKLLRKKYGWQYAAMTTAQKIFSRGNRIQTIICLSEIKPLASSDSAS
ncbi:MAG: PPOX class F420-dependent oxidoreductase [Antricoccus sp.]